MIIQTGINDAIAGKLNPKGRLSKNAIAEGIINNVRKTIIRDQLTDPKFYAEMSSLLDDLIRQKRDDTAAYEEFLRKAEALVKKIHSGGALDDVPPALAGKPEAMVLYRNLQDIVSDPVLKGLVRETADEYGDARAGIALRLDEALRTQAPANWKGDSVKEAQVLNAIYPIMSRNDEATRKIFTIIKQQAGY